MQKTIVAAALAAAVGTGIYAIHQGAQLRGQIQTLQQQQAPLTAQIQQLEQERDQATNQLAALRDGKRAVEIRLEHDRAAEIARPGGDAPAAGGGGRSKNNQPASGLDKMMSDPAMKEYLRQAQKEKIRSMYADLFKELKLTPEQSDQFLNALCDNAAKSPEPDHVPGNLDPSAADANAALGSQLQALLGDAGMARFKEYSDEIPARTTVSLLNGQLETIRSAPSKAPNCSRWSRPSRRI